MNVGTRVHADPMLICQAPGCATTDHDRPLHVFQVGAGAPEDDVTVVACPEHVGAFL